jgi:hypothetical protein
VGDGWMTIKAAAAMVGDFIRTSGKDQADEYDHR